MAQIIWRVLLGVCFMHCMGAAAANPLEKSTVECAPTRAQTVMCRLVPIDAQASDLETGGAEAAPISEQEVFRDTPKFLSAWVEYFPDTCTLSSSGQWIVDVSPTYGIVYTAIESFPLSGGLCPGVEFPFNVLYYVWSSDSNKSHDTTTATWYASCCANATQFNLTRIPVISGSPTLWWFDGEKPANYPVRSTLKVNTKTYSTYEWSIGNGAARASFANGASAITTSKNRADVLSIAASRKRKDVSITVTVDGHVSDPFLLTVRAPTSLGAIRIDDKRHPAFPATGYRTEVWYETRDQWGVALPTTLIPLNEEFTGAPIDDFAGQDWTQAINGGATVNPALWRDVIANANQTIPPSLPPQRPVLGAVMVKHWPGQWQIGSLGIGKGRRVQRNTWQLFQDHGRHTDVVSPAP